MESLGRAGLAKPALVLPAVIAGTGLILIALSAGVGFQDDTLDATMTSGLDSGHDEALGTAVPGRTSLPRRQATEEDGLTRAQLAPDQLTQPLLEPEPGGPDRLSLNQDLLTERDRLLLRAAGETIEDLEWARREGQALGRRVRKSIVMRLGGRYTQTTPEAAAEAMAADLVWSRLAEGYVVVDGDRDSILTILSGFVHELRRSIDEDLPRSVDSNPSETFSFRRSAEASRAMSRALKLCDARLDERARAVDQHIRAILADGILDRSASLLSNNEP